ncbi:MAG: hypothetical protein CMJ88_05920 [Planctomycetes bacterium]|nr:hypothetical protein [Planctomycetota bacterium]
MTRAEGPAVSTRDVERRRRRSELRRRRHSAAIAGGVLALLWWTADIFSGPARSTWPRREILDALRWVESGDLPDAQVPDGDDGLAIGPYQIHRVYWRDAIDFDDELDGAYRDCRKASYAERVIHAYMRRHAPNAWARGDAERIARTHNGGPEGHRKRATDDYWRRVQARLYAH